MEKVRSKYLFAALCSIPFPVAIVAGCGAADPSEIEAPQVASSPEPMIANKTIPVRFLQMKTASTETTVSTADVDARLVDAGKVYAPLGLTFKRRGTAVEPYLMPAFAEMSCAVVKTWAEVKTSLQHVVPGAGTYVYRDTDSMNICRWLMDFSTRYLDHNVINVWLGTTGWPWGGVPELGHIVYMPRGTVENAVTNPSPFKLSHELGHYFGIAHTWDQASDGATNQPDKKSTYWDLVYARIVGADGTVTGIKTFASAAEAATAGEANLLWKTTTDAANCRVNGVDSGYPWGAPCTVRCEIEGQLYTSGSPVLGGLATDANGIPAPNVMSYVVATDDTGSAEYCRPGITAAQAAAADKWLTYNWDLSNWEAAPGYASDRDELGWPGFGPPQKWHNGACTPGQECFVADIHGDGIDDIVVFTKNTPGQEGDVWVARSYGYSTFGPPEKWHDWACTGNETCAVADVNKDKRADLVVFKKSTVAGQEGDVWVALSDGTGFGTLKKWHDWACVGNETCALADVDGKNGADIVVFTKNATPGKEGDVWVALSNGSSGFGAAKKWHDWACVGNETCALADVNNDGKADVVVFVKDATPGYENDVWVAVSNGSSFGAAKKWHDWACLKGQTCALADVDGKNGADVVVFVQGATPGQENDVWVALSNGTSSFGAPRRWDNAFCKAGQTCRVGRVNRDSLYDLVAFVKDAPTPGGLESANNVMVALSNPLQ